MGFYGSDKLGLPIGRSAIETIIDKISPPGTGRVYVGKEYTTADLIKDLRSAQARYEQAAVNFEHQLLD